MSAVSVKDQRASFQKSIDDYRAEINTQKSILQSKNSTDAQKNEAQGRLALAQQQFDFYSGLLADINATNEPVDFKKSFDAEFNAPAPKKTSNDLLKEKGFASSNYLQNSVLNDPFYVNAGTYSGLGGLFGGKTPNESYGSDLKQGRWGMTPLLAAKQLISVGIKPTISPNLLANYKQVAQGKLGASSAEKQAAQLFLDFLNKNKNKFNLK